MATKIEDAFTAELTRLMARGLTQEEEVIARRYYSQKERKGMDESSFCGPHRSFPITSQADVDNAAHLIGKADNPDAVKACIKGKAKANGWSIPDSWQDKGKSEDRAMMASEPVPATNESSEHEPMTGKHSHGHAHSLDGYDHEHEHEHNNDNVHDHAHMHAQHRDAPVTASDRVSIYMPLVRFADENGAWLVEGQASSDIIDGYETIFEYPSLKRAFERWRGNIREMHQRKAVGHKIRWMGNDDAKSIVLRSFVSKAAPDTWQKVLEGVLNAYSIALKPGYKEKYTQRDGRNILTYYDFDLAEVSLVDNPGSPGCDIQIVRADGMATEILDTDEDTITPAPTGIGSPDPVVERAGARLSSDSRAALHDMRDKAMSLCGCDECQGMAGKNDDDEDDASRAVVALVERVLPSVIERMLQPVYQRQQHFLARMAQTPETTPQPLDTTALEERLTTAIVERVTSASSLPELRAELSAVKETVERIERQPAVGLAPILNGSRPVDKTFPLDRAASTHQSSPAQAGVMQQALHAMQGAGMLDTQDMQTKAASLILQMQQNR